MKFDVLTLKKGKERSLERRHPWVFSGAFVGIPQLKEGQLVKIQNSKKEILGIGFFHHGSITVKVLSFKDIDNVNDLIAEKLNKALSYREEFLDQSHTNCYRLVFGEGDGLPGLMIDRYDKTAVIQVHHNGWIPFLEQIAEILTSCVYLETVVSKPSEKLKNHGLEPFSYLKGSKQDQNVIENGNAFIIDWEKGQKTGFFIDQRENRKRLGELSRGKSVLNTFSYTGGFSIYALKNGATKAVSVDLSQSAVDLANKNAELNGVEKRHEGVAADVFDYLKSEGEKYDVVILDPPAFSKNKRTVHNAVQAYKRLNLLAMKKIKKGGILFSFSCSQHVNPKLFEDTIRAAAIEAKREVILMEKLGQPLDHPINMFYPEGEYLKGLVLKIH